MVGRPSHPPPTREGLSAADSCTTGPAEKSRGSWAAVRSARPAGHPLNFRTEYHGYTVSLLQDAAECGRFEFELAQSGIILPFPHRSAWLWSQPSERLVVFGIRDSAGKAAFSFPLVMTPSRALPGHANGWVERFRPADPAGTEAGLHALTDFARSQPGLLRIHVEVFSRDHVARDATGKIATQLGFCRRSSNRTYARTISVDLAPDESRIFDSLHPTARRHIRALRKHGLVLRPVVDRNCADRMSGLLHETMSRTGGHSFKIDWENIIDLSARYPDQSRIVGVFRDDSLAPDSLLAYAWGRYHGDNADYAVAASARPADLKLPLGYAPAWDLICWARQAGATWFDFGGISLGNHGSTDPLGGISDFKRYFSKDMITVGEEWTFDARPVRALLARTIGKGAAWARNLGTT